jgi:coenzyme F420-reducing hydrogenase delta subunit
MNQQSKNIYVFYCSANGKAMESMSSYFDENRELKAVPLPCAAKIDVPYLTKAFETGADGVAVLICQRGKCLFLEGDLRAKKRAEVVDVLMEESGLGKGRVAVIQIQEDDARQAISEMESFQNSIKILAHQGR